MIKGVITGDLVNSTNIAAKWRQTVVDTLHVCIEPCKGYRSYGRS